MIIINYPEPDFKMKKVGDKEFIFDPIRKKWIVLTPEEWVRQNFLQYLIQVKKYPVALIAIEKEIQLGELNKRFDVLVYDTLHNPFILVECKATTVKLDDIVAQQVLRYNISVPVKFMIITNGENTFCWQKEWNDLLLINEIPSWK